MKLRSPADDIASLKVSEDDDRRKTRIMDKLSEIQKMTLLQDIGDKMTQMVREAEIKRVLKTPPLARTDSDLKLV